MNYPIPNWLSQSADPAGQYATGLGIGVRIGAEQAAQQLAQQQLLRRDAENEFERQYKSQVLQMDIDRVMRQQQAERTFQDLLRQGVPADQALMQVGPAMGEKISDVLQTQQMAQYRNAQLAEQRAYHRQNAPGVVQPEARTITDPATGKPISVIRTGPNTWREPRGEGESIQFTSPSGETMVINRGGAKGTGAMPAAMVTRAEESIVGAVNAAKLGASLLQRLRPEDIGVLGRGGELVVDESLAQIVPGAANLGRVDSRTLLRMFKNDFTRALKTDSQMSEPERKAIEEMLPGLGVKESLPTALQKIKTATREAAERSRVIAGRSGRQIPNELLKPQELIEKVRRGELTPAQATALAKISPYRDDFDAIIPR